MSMTVNPIMKVEALTPQAWIASLQPSGLLNLLQIPHFGRNNEINAVVNNTIDSIHRITGLSTTGAEPATHFVGRD